MNKWQVELKSEAKKFNGWHKCQILCIVDVSAAYSLPHSSCGLWCLYWLIVFSLIV
jgi:hypothetical protein